MPTRGQQTAAAPARSQMGKIIALTAAAAAAAIIFQILGAKAETYKSQAHSFTVTPVAKGLQHPWSIAFLPGGDMLVSERDGDLRLIRDGKLVEKAVSGVPKALAAGQGGLLGLAVHPKFAENQLVYLAYSGRGTGGAGTEIARGVLRDGALENVEVIFKVEPKTGGTAHYGGRLAFTPAGDLIATFGDRYSQMKLSQTLDNHLGKVIRLRDDGKAPDDNPFAKQSGAKPEIFTYGHRNVQGLAMRPGTDQIWTHEFGPEGGDELNLLKAGANYGWPKITYGRDYGGGVISNQKQAPGMEQPAAYWVPSISPSGMTFYDGDKFPQWKGNIFMGALSAAHLRRITLDGDKVAAQEPLLEDLGERIRDVAQGPDGLLYVLTDDPSNGQVLRLSPSSSAASIR